jgi:hypothetical protein
MKQGNRPADVAFLGLAALAVLLGLATALTVWRPDWVEVLGLGDPDAGSGAVELLLVVVLAVATTATALGTGLRFAWHGPHR